jgi:putative inorganic carbon (hco3(-)) transporter
MLLNQIMTNPNTIDNNKYKHWYYLVIVYLLFDYGRLHETFHLGFVKPLMIINLLLIIMILHSGQLFNLLNKQIKLMFLFILLLAMYIPFARNNFLAYNSTKTMFLYAPFVISTIICINSINRLKSILLFCVLIAAYISLYSITHKGYGPGNYFLDENDLSLYIDMWIPFCYFLFIAEQNKIKKVLYAISLILGLMAIVVSFSRGGFVGLIAGALAIWMIGQRKFSSIVIITLIALLIFNFSGTTYRAEMETITDTHESTAAERIESWKSAWNMFLANPLGVGGDNFMVLFPEYQTNYFKRGMWGRAAHSIWFTLIPELGIGGIIIFSLLLYYNIRDIFFLKNVNSKGRNKEKIYLNYVGCAFIASLVSFFVSGTFLSVLYYAHYWYMTGFIVAAANIANQMNATEEAK